MADRQTDRQGFNLDNNLASNQRAIARDFARQPDQVVSNENVRCRWYISSSELSVEERREGEEKRPTRSSTDHQRCRWYISSSELRDDDSSKEVGDDQQAETESTVSNCGEQDEEVPRVATHRDSKGTCAAYYSTSSSEDSGARATDISKSLKRTHAHDGCSTNQASGENNACATLPRKKVFTNKRVSEKTGLRMALSHFNLEKIQFIMESNSRLLLCRSWTLHQSAPEVPDKVVLKLSRADGNTVGEGRFNSRRYRREVETLTAVHDRQHPNIVRLLGHTDLPGHHALVLSFCPGGTLTARIHRLPDAAVFNILAKVSDALHYLHVHAFVVHRDVKLDNIMFGFHGQPVLIDFDLACKVSADSCLVKGQRGTEGYMAPELVNGEPKGVYNGFRLDAYALGVVLLCMLRGYDLSGGENYNRALTILFSRNIPPLLRDLGPVAYGLLNPDWERRWEMPNVVDFLLYLYNQIYSSEDMYQAAAGKGLA